MAQTVRSAGTMIGAILESTGYHYQAAILDALQNPFQNEVGGLIYLVGVVVALVAFATRGGFNHTPWLLIGPPLFFAVILDRENIPNARWEFGLQGRLQPPVDEGVRQLYQGGQAEANVSKTFSRFVQMTSSTAKQMVATISTGREQTDLWFMMKGQLFGMMHIPGAEEPGLQRLLHLSLLQGCGQLIRYAQMMNNPIYRANDPSLAAYERTPGFTEARQFFVPTRNAARQRFLELYRHSFNNLDGQAARYVATLELGADADDEAIQTRAEELTHNTTVNCFDVWGWVLQGILSHARRHTNREMQLAAENMISPGVISNLMLQSQGVQRNAPITYIGGVTLNLPAIPGVGTVNPITIPEIPINQQITAQDIQAISHIIARFYLRNEANNVDRGSMISWFGARHEVRTLGMRSENGNNFAERVRNQIQQFALKEKLMHAASALPYYQGLALYFMGIFFPFFALLLLVPGKWTGFIQWFLLWIWIKSWDVGFAIVMLLDDMFFAIFSIERQARGQVEQIGQDQQAELEFAAAALREMDPTFQMSTYYSLMSICVLAIPPVTAQLFLGTMKTGANLIAEGVKDYTKHYFDAALQRSVREAQYAIKHDIQQNVRDRAQAYHYNAMRNNALERGGQIQAPTGNAIMPGGPVIQGVAQMGNPGLVAGHNFERATVAQAYQAGHAAGITQGNRDFTGLGTETRRFLEGAGFVMSGPQAHMGLARFQNMQNIAGAERQAVAARAWWDADASQSQAALYELGAIVGFMPLPWANFVDDDPWKMNFELAIARRQAEINDMIANTRATQEGLRQLLTIGRDVMGRNVTAQEIAAAPVGQRNAIYARFATSLNSFASNPIRIAGASFATAGVINNSGEWQSFINNSVDMMHRSMTDPRRGTTTPSFRPDLPVTPGTTHTPGPGYR